MRHRIYGIRLLLISTHLRAASLFVVKGLPQKTPSLGLINALFGLAAVPLVSAPVRSLDGIRNDAASDIVPNAYIVELHDPASMNNFGIRATVHGACFFVGPYTAQNS